ncbi:MAG TPA: DUF6152 family protein [Terriglobia bacterium]|nr:DUF6152 family protein [Terriglobia bacterium]
MRRLSFSGIAVLAVVIAWGIPATAHHSQAFYFDTTKAITLEGEIVRVEWINPHILVFMQSKNEKGEMETWTIEGSSPNNALRRVGLKEKLQPGTAVSIRAHPSRNPLYLNDALTVLVTRPDDARKSSRIVDGGQIRFPNGDVETIGGGPAF